MNEDFAPFELAVKLKEKGFREECLCHYIGEDLVYNIESPIANNQLWFCHNKYDNIWHRDNVDAPTIPQVLKWLRKVKGMEVYSNYNRVYKHWTYIARAFDDSCYNSVGGFKTYEQATLEGIEYVLDNLI